MWNRRRPGSSCDDDGPRPHRDPPASPRHLRPALRRRGVNARALIEAVWRAGGSRTGHHPPHRPGRQRRRRRLPRLSLRRRPARRRAPRTAPLRSTGRPSMAVSRRRRPAGRVRSTRSVARQALAGGLPLLAICRADCKWSTPSWAAPSTRTWAASRREHRHVRHPAWAHSPPARPRPASPRPTRPKRCYHHSARGPPGEGLHRHRPGRRRNDRGGRTRRRPCPAL